MNHINYINYHKQQKSKTSSDGICLGEPLGCFCNVGYHLHFAVAEKLETRNEKWEMITCQYNLLFSIFKLFICQQCNNGFAY